MNRQLTSSRAEEGERDRERQLSVLTNLDRRDRFGAMDHVLSAEI